MCAREAGPPTRGVGHPHDALDQVGLGGPAVRPGVGPEPGLDGGMVPQRASTRAVPDRPNRRPGPRRARSRRRNPAVHRPSGDDQPVDRAQGGLQAPEPEAVGGERGPWQPRRKRHRRRLPRGPGAGGCPGCRASGYEPAGVPSGAGAGRRRRRGSRGCGGPPSPAATPAPARARRTSGRAGRPG